MIMKATTIEQSERLERLGFNPNTADLSYQHIAHDDEAPTFCFSLAKAKTFDIPAWSLSSLLDAIPETVITDDGDEYTLQIGKDDDLTYVFGYDCEYTATNVVEFVSQEAVEAAYELVCWLLENKYI